MHTSVINLTAERKRRHGIRVLEELIALQKAEEARHRSLLAQLGPKDGAVYQEFIDIGTEAHIHAQKELNTLLSLDPSKRVR